MKKILLSILILPFLGGCSDTSDLKEAPAAAEGSLHVNGQALIPVSESGLLDRDGNPLREEGLYLCQGTIGPIMDIGQDYLQVFFTQAFCNGAGESLGGSGDIRNIQTADWQKVYFTKETQFELVYTSAGTLIRRSPAAVGDLFLEDTVNVTAQWGSSPLVAEKIEIFINE